jgi:hypothetical protein
MDVSVFSVFDTMDYLPLILVLHPRFRPPNRPWRAVFEPKTQAALDARFVRTEEGKYILRNNTRAPQVWMVHTPDFPRFIGDRVAFMGADP